MQGFGGILQVDGYAGYNRLSAPERIGRGIRQAYWWAHAHRKLIDITRSGPAPIAEEGIHLIRELYRIEADIRGQSADDRLSARQERSAPVMARINDWLNHHRACVSPKSPLGEALKYIVRYWQGLSLFLTCGRVGIDSNSVERTIRPIALNRKNALFAGHDEGARNWAIIASLIETCKLNDVESQAWLSATLKAIVNGHKQSKIRRTHAVEL